MNDWIKSNGASLGRATFMLTVVGLLFGLLFEIRADNRELRNDLQETREDLGNDIQETREEQRNDNRETREELRNEIRVNRDAVDDLRLEVNQSSHRADERIDKVGDDSTRRIDATNGRIDEVNRRVDDLSGQINFRLQPGPDGPDTDGEANEG